MIKITKPATPPLILTTAGRRKCTALCKEYTRFVNSVTPATLELNFDAAVYGHPKVKQALIEAQHEKCCFCESKVGEEGDIELFVPKPLFGKAQTCHWKNRGYYWLAYEWDNLLLCCSPCNQRHKKNLFPLADPSTRARSHNDSIAEEEPLLIHPFMLIQRGTYHSIKKLLSVSTTAGRANKRSML